MKLPFWPPPSSYRNIELGLGRVSELLKRLDNPHLKIPPTIHLAGTNGKGSTLAYLKAIFEDANLKVHCYISPHLVHFNERIILSGKEIEDELLNEILKECKAAAEQDPKIDITFFEGVTAAAFVAYSRIKADVLLLETGLGGRLDATNVIKSPIATVITPIDFDHTEFLGKTLAKIASEKAGIIKPKSPVIISKQRTEVLKILKETAKKNDSEVFSFDQKYNLKISPNLLGKHQIINAKCAVATILAQKQFKISKENIERGLQKAVWKARLQKITEGNLVKILPKNSELFLDGGHNKAGAKIISDWLKNEIKKYPKTKNYLICGMLQDKDSKGFLKYFIKQTELLIGLKISEETKSKTAKEICDIAKDLDIKALEAMNFSDAIEKIKKHHLKNYQNLPAKIIICGSLYLAGDFLNLNKSK